jgi:hypothetical protein
MFHQSKEGINMDIGKTIKQVAALAALVSAFVALPQVQMSYSFF